MSNPIKLPFGVTTTDHIDEDEFKWLILNNLDKTDLISLWNFWNTHSVYELHDQGESLTEVWEDFINCVINDAILALEGGHA